MPYNGTIPGPNDLISVSQGQIQGNFASILAAFDQNHADFNAGGNIAGQHSFVQFQPQTAWPVIGSFPTTEGFWADAANIYLHNLAGADVNLTQYACITSGLGSGYFHVPCGILVQFGRATATGGAGVITYPVDYPAGHIPYVLITGMQSTTGGFSTYASVNQTAGITNHVCNFNLRQQDPSTFQMVAATGPVEWIAIGI
jgi:hypothetical protein